MPKFYINDLYFHKDTVSQIEWSPSSENLLLSSSSDGKVYLWDNSKSGEEQARTDYQDGPPELMFQHETHQRNPIEDICWNPFGEVNGEEVSEQKNMVVSVDT